MAKMVVHAVIILLLLAILYQVCRPSRSVSMFVPASAPLETKSQGGDRPASIFGLTPSLECTPGPSEKASYYTSGLTPGGLCGDGDFVRDEMRVYSISDGIGGSLLDK
jgi:hypothetical protein